MRALVSSICVLACCASFGQGAPSIIWSLPTDGFGGDSQFTADGQFILDGTNFAAVHLRSAATGASQWNVVGDFFYPRTLDISPDGTLFLLGRTQNGLGRPSVYRMSDQTLVRQFNTQFDCYEATFGTSSDEVLAGGSNAYKWNVTTGDLIDTYPGYSCSLSITPDRTRLIQATFGNHIFIRDLATDQIVWDFAITAQPRIVRPTPNGQQIVVVNDNGVMEIWNLNSGVKEREWQAFPAGWGFVWPTLAISPDGRYAVTTFGNKAMVKVWRLSDGALVRYYDTDRDTSGVSISPDGRSFFYGDRTRILHGVFPAPPEDVLPDTMVVKLGRLDSGNVASLFDIEGNALRVCKFLVPNVTTPPVNVELTGTSTRLTPSVLKFRVSSRMDTSGAFAIKLRLFNYDAGFFEEFAASGLGMSYSMTEITAMGDLGRFVDDNGQLRAGYSVAASGPVGSALWCHEAELARWHIE